MFLYIYSIILNLYLYIDIYFDEIFVFIEWCNEYNDSIRSENEIQKEINKYMSTYDQQIADRIAKQKAAKDMEEDGWVTITSRKKRGQFAPSRKESTIKKIQNKEEQKNHKKQLLNFYTFQIRESKKQRMYFFNFIFCYMLCLSYVIIIFLLKFYSRFGGITKEI